MLFGPFEDQNALGQTNAPDMLAADIERDRNLSPSRWIEDVVDITVGRIW